MSKRAPGRARAPSRSADKSSQSWVRASDLAAWAYCRRAWWLARVQGVEPADRAPLDAGDALHHRHGQSIARARLLRTAGILLLALALLSLLASLLAMALLTPG